MSWRVADIPVPEQLGEAVADALSAAGAHGVSEEWQDGRTSVRGFWKDTTEAEARAATARALCGLVDAGLLPALPPVTYSTLDDADWLEGWKQYFSPLEISPRLLVTPSWEATAPRPGQAVLVLDPGMAFGTGSHGTTFGCLRALSDVVRPGMSICDVGTGSGILAIAAVKLGAARVVATDNDELSIRVARENAARNGVEAAIDFRVADLLTGVNGPFDLMAANILAPVILALIPLLPPVLRPGGLFISSGYLADQEAEIRRALDAAGHQVRSRHQHDAWVTLVSSAG